MMARAIATRRRMPPESSAVSISSLCSSSTKRKASRTLRSISSSYIPCSSINRYATFSRTVRESNRALSWKTIPILPRNVNRSSSRICEMSCPSTNMRPESGRMSPMTSFNIRLFPEPATPNSALVSPRARRKETPRRTSFPAKPSSTSSNTTTGEGSSFVITEAESSGKVGADIGLTVGKHGHEKSSYEKVEHENQHGRSDHGLRRGPAHALGSPARIHAVEAAYGRDNETKQNRLHQSHKHVLKNQR